MTAHLLDARLVVGGLWAGAWCRFEDEVADWEASYDPGNDDWQARDLVLPGPLGLGAAGLAVRLLQRVGVPERDAMRSRAHPQTVSIVLDRAGIDRSVLDAVPVADEDRLEDWHWRHLARLSERFAMTDALCAAVGLKLEAGEVARWTHTKAGPVMGWTLQTAAGAFFFCDDAGMAVLGCHVPALATTSDDAHASLRACWGALCQS